MRSFAPAISSAVRVAIGSFDGVHRGHRAVVDAVRATGLGSTVITFDPHPRIALGNRVELLTTLERGSSCSRRRESRTSLVAPFTVELQQLTPDDFAERYLRATGVEAVVAGADFRFGVRRSGDLALLERLRFEVVVVPRAAGRLVHRDPRRRSRRATLEAAAGMLGRPFELDGVVVAGDQRGGTLGYPTANLRLEPDLACPAYGIYAGFGLGHRAAISIGTNPHYGGTERRIEPYLLDFDGDLYGKRLVVELWERLRDEAVFESEQALDRPDRPRRGGDEACTQAVGAIASVDRVSQDNGHPLIQARDLVKRFGDFVAVDGIDFDVQRGEAFGFLGPNGAGKTSTMRMIGCVSPVTDGTLRVLGLDPASDGPADPRAARRRAAGGHARHRADRAREPRSSTAATSASRARQLPRAGRRAARVRRSSRSARTTGSSRCRAA